jgi:hypothetical protein
MREIDDWRLTNQDRYLKGVELIWRAYKSANPSNDHDHCEFCWAKFMADESIDALREGYATDDRYRWICKTCFDDFSDLFGWRVAGMSNTAVNIEPPTASRLP